MYTFELDLNEVYLKQIVSIFYSTFYHLSTIISVPKNEREKAVTTAPDYHKWPLDLFKIL